jgi:hypothetical protein
MRGRVSDTVKGERIKIRSEIYFIVTVNLNERCNRGIKLKK